MKIQTVRQERAAQKDAILAARRDIKRQGHAVVKSHYMVLVFLTLVMVLFGTEFQYATSGWNTNPQVGGESSFTGDQTAEAVPGESSDKSAEDGSAIPSGSVNTLTDRSSVFSELITDLIGDTLYNSIRKSENKLEAYQEEKTIPALGRSEGVLAQLVNMVSSGNLLTRLAESVLSITHSGKAAAAILILLSFLFYGSIFVFLKNVYSAVLRRVFLQARVYERISVSDVTHFHDVRKWFRASVTMLVKYFYESLWGLTIVGGVIKYFSYYAVPYIVAENPSLNARTAITLSRRMMYGHKWELAKFLFTMAGWYVLSVVTFGISDLAYGIAYRLSCGTEFYARIREDAISRGVEGTELLNDRYLFEKADRILLYETYFEVVDEITDIHEKQVELSGWRKKCAEWLGIWFGSAAEKKTYDEQENRSFSIEGYKDCMEGKAYPQWLNPLWRKEKAGLKTFSFLRSYSVWTLFLLFIAFAFTGWIWEVALHFIQTGEWVNRGTLHGPWLPIYGTGGVIVMVLCTRFRKKPILEFAAAVILCGIIEYFTGFFLEVVYHQRWWSYEGYFLNLHGRICAEGLLVFGVGCCAVVYLLAPMFDSLISRIRQKTVIAAAVVLAVVFGIDLVYSTGNPNTAEGAASAVAAEMLPSSPLYKIAVTVQSQTPEMAKNAISGVVVYSPDANLYGIMDFSQLNP